MLKHKLQFQRSSGCLAPKRQPEPPVRKDAAPATSIIEATLEHLKNNGSVKTMQLRLKQRSRMRARPVEARLKAVLKLLIHYQSKPVITI